MARHREVGSVACDVARQGRTRGCDGTDAPGGFDRTVAGIALFAMFAVGLLCLPIACLAFGASVIRTFVLQRVRPAETAASPWAFPSSD